MEKEIKALECKFCHHIPAVKDLREDTHLVKERVYYTDGTSELRLRPIYHFKRPFWVTKEPYKNHKQKKESELLSRVTEYQSTQSALPFEIAKRIGKNPRTVKSLRDVIDSPYLYGVDVESRAFLKKQYLNKYGEMFSPYTVCGLDTEVDIETNELLLITVATEKESYTAILKSFVSRFKDPIRQLEYIYSKYIPKSTVSETLKPKFELFDSEVELITNAFKRVHSWKPDFLEIWNLSYDMNVMLGVLKKAGMDPKDVFSDPSLPENLRYFRYQEDNSSKVTASGVNKPPGPHERWHIVKSSSSFYWIDGMCAYNYVRVGTKAVPGGYGLDNVLGKELGKNLQKLKFEDENTSKLTGVDWHKYMTHNKPLEYVIYNVWDVLSMLELDLKTKDLSTSVPVLSGCSSFDNFKSGPKKIIDELIFFYLNHGRVLGTRPSNRDESEISLKNWIVLLPSHRTKDNGLKALNETKHITTNIRLSVYDADQVSGYPSNSQAINISGDTMSKEVLEYIGIDPMVAKLQNINLVFGPINSVEYCNTMFNFPKLYQLSGLIKDSDLPNLDNNIIMDESSSNEDDDDDNSNDDD